MPDIRRLAGFAAALALTACSALPRDAPTSEAIRADAAALLGDDQTRIPYALVKLSAATLAAANHAHVSDASPLADLPARGASERRATLGVGDVLSVAVFESAPGGLFLPAEGGARNGNFVQVPNEQIDASGMINVPYAGAISVAGLTPRQAGAEISRRLAHRAIEPQSVVSLVDRRSAGISVIGDVNNPNRLPFDPGGISLVDAIARVGGNHDPDYETLVTVQRGGHNYRCMLSAIVANPARNIRLQAGDVVYLGHKPQYFLEFGAAGERTGAQSHRVTFESDTMTLAEGLAKGGGLRDERSDASSVFVFRYESKGLLRELGANVAGFANGAVPTVYAVDLNASDGVFLMSRFQLSSGDVVVVSNAASVEFLKFLNVLTEATAAPYNVASTRYDLQH